MRKIKVAFQGFSLLEVMVVVVIIGMLATVVTMGVIDQLEKARRTTATAQMHEFLKVLSFYTMDKGGFPSTGQGLKALLQKKPGSDNPYLNEIPKDPWGHEYRYRLVGNHCEMTSYGSDGRSGGTGTAEDIIISSQGKQNK
jgi:general secretion pathway protein G